MSSEMAISARGLGKAYKIYNKPFDRLKQMAWRGRRTYYREFWALRHVDFDVYKGETVGIIGPNGAGKSTLLQMVCGTVTPSEGEVSVRGRVAALLALGAGFNPEFTGRENVFVNAAVLGLQDHEIRARFDAIAAFADIGSFIDQPVRTYSSGMYARLAFAVAVHVDPEILIVDEILAVGDASFQRKCIERFYQIRDSGCTILFVSHDPYQVKTVCKRAIYLSGGERVAYGAAGDVIERYIYDMEQKNARARATAAHQQVEPVNTSQPVAPADGQAPAAPAAPAAPSAAPPVQPEAPFRIISVRLENADGQEVQEVLSGTDIQIRMRYVAQAPDFPRKVSFVVNLYRHDDFYICGTTTLMEGLEPFDAAAEGEVLIKFPRFQLLAGNYNWRVAINDDRGLIIYADAKHICPIRVVDRFRAVGLVDLPREWCVTNGPRAAAVESVSAAP